MRTMSTQCNVAANADEIRCTAIRIIDRNMDFDALLKEMSSIEVNVSASRSPGIDSKVSVQAILEGLKLQVSLGQMDIASAATQMVLKRLCVMSQAFEMFLEDGLKKDNFLSVLMAYKKVLPSPHIDVQILSQYEDDFQHCLPINVLLELHSMNVLALRDFLIVNVNNKHVLKEFIWCLQKATKKNDGEDRPNSRQALNTLTGIFICLIQYAYGDEAANNKALKKMCSYILFNVIKHHLQYLIALPPSKSISSEEHSFIKAMSEKMDREKGVLQRCFKQMISLWVTNSPTIKVSDAIWTQHTWSACKQSEKLTTFYKEIIECIGPSDAVTCISAILDRKEVNWRNLLTFISALLVSYKDAPNNLDGLIDAKLKSGVESLCKDSLMIAFLLARQLSLEGSHVFSSYAAWFQKHFGANSSLVSSNRTFRFFIGFLTDLVPYEPARYLKVHVIKPPHAQASCKEKLESYLILARCRIADLGITLLESAEDSGKSAEVEKDVKVAVDEFERSKRIPKSLMEASIFKKSYFLGKFLPTLLRPRLLPSIPDGTMGLIEELSKAQKIPKNLLAEYKDACKKENIQILKEVMALEAASAFEDEEDDPIVGVEAVLQTISSEIQKLVSGPSTGSQSLPSELLTKLKRTLNTIPTDIGAGSSSDDAEQIDEIDLSGTVSINPNLQKLSLKLLEWSGNFHDAVAKVTNEENTLISCLKCVLKVIQEQRRIMLGLCAYLWKICIFEVSTASDLLLKGIALYLKLAGHEIQVLTPVMPHCELLVQKSTELVDRLRNWQTIRSCNLQVAIKYYLPFQSDGESMLAAAKFFCYLAEVIISRDKALDPYLLCHLQYFYTRLKAKSCLESVLSLQTEEPVIKKSRMEHEEISKCVDLLARVLRKSPEDLEDCLSLSLDEFVVRESSICLEKDVLSSRERSTLYARMFLRQNLSQKDIKAVLHCLLDIWALDCAHVKNTQVTDELLRNLPLMFEACAMDSTCDLMLDVFTERTCGGTFNLWDEIRHKGECEAFIRLLVHLPHSTLFASKPHEMETSDIWSCRDELKNCNTTDNLLGVRKLLTLVYSACEKNHHCSFALPQVLVNHLLCGVLEVFKGLHDILEFIVLSCPWLFIGVIKYWANDPRMQLCTSLRNQELHSLVVSTVKLIYQESPDHTINHAVELLLTKLPKSEENRAHANLCISCMAVDLFDGSLTLDRMTSLLREAPKELLGCVTACVVWKVGCIDCGSDSVSSRYVMQLAKLLEHCLQNMDSGYAFSVFLNGVPSLLSFVPDLKMVRFHLRALRCLSMITVPRNILRHPKFLPTLTTLEASSSGLFGHGESFKLSHLGTDVQRLHNLASEHHTTRHPS